MTDLLVSISTLIDGPPSRRTGLLVLIVALWCSGLLSRAWKQKEKGNKRKKKQPPTVFFNLRCAHFSPACSLVNGAPTALFALGSCWNRDAQARPENDSLNFSERICHTLACRSTIELRVRVIEFAAHKMTAHEGGSFASSSSHF